MFFQVAIGKYRTLHGEYKRVQRDYEALQGIVRQDTGAKLEEAEGDEQLKKVMTSGLVVSIDVPFTVSNSLRGSRP